MSTHEHYMHRAIELAKRAQGNTSPNPLVGAVIVRNDHVIGEGWHKQAGHAHAEVDAIKNANANDRSTKDATIYVSLEPCSHQGKTPPCTQAILEAGITKLVYATSDTNTNASGGAEFLRSAGVEVISNICEKEARQVNRFFFHYHEHKTPYVIAKFASSLDGRTATRSGNSQWITGIQSRQRGHVARQAVDAIIVGAQTAIADQPQLTVRNEDAHKHTTPAHPIRILLDSKGRVPLDNSLFDAALPGKTMVVTTDSMPDAHAQQLIEQNIEVIRLARATGTNYPDLTILLKELGNRDIHSVLVEGGHTVIGNFLDNQLINEVWAFIAPKLIGGINAAPCVGGLGFDKLEHAPSLTQLSIEQLDNDILIKGIIESAPNANRIGAN